MIGQIRNSVTIKALWGLMGLYLLNISVDTADPNPEHIPEDLSFNDQESIIEIVLEKVLGFENIIEEYDDYDPEDHNHKNHIKIDLIAQSQVGNSANQLYFEKTGQNLYCYRDRLTSGFQRLDTPPPKI